ncbi:Septum formation protein Maf [anaerobic digester metagenome]
MNIILASESPRRLELMKYLTDDYLVIPSDFQEREVSFNGDPIHYCKELAYQKARTVSEKYPDDLILGSDTIVVIDGLILNKPQDRAEAREMIQRLQGRVHEVMTAFAILNPTQEIKVIDQVATRVCFAPMTDGEIESYLEQGDFRGKAGAYAIQGAAAPFIDFIEGDFYTVVGLPVSRLYKEFRKLGVI